MTARKTYCYAYRATVVFCSRREGRRDRTRSLSCLCPLVTARARERNICFGPSISYKTVGCPERRSNRSVRSFVRRLSSVACLFNRVCPLRRGETEREEEEKFSYLLDKNYKVDSVVVLSTKKKFVISAIQIIRDR